MVVKQNSRMLKSFFKFMRRNGQPGLAALPSPPPQAGLRFRDTLPVFPSSKGKLWHATSNVTLSLGGVIGQLLVWKLSETKVYNQEYFQESVLDRVPGTPIISASNHKAVTDDWLLCSILGTHKQALTGDMRYVMGAEEVMFWSYKLAHICAIAHILPIRRGFGVYQPVMDEAINLLGQGRWLHIYPQGRILHKREEDATQRLKWGIGRLVADCPTFPAPKILPMWHVGMDDFMPNVRPYRMHLGQRITLVLGKAMDFTDQLKEMRERNCSQMRIRKQITDQVQDRLSEIREEAWALHDARS
ncbi:tafazzin-like [Sycon ciliatum]|uniref:tafazzin-like n=1 Tax=Sycon ciliatum TaxID=27933 RepID=UPI0031F6A855